MHGILRFERSILVRVAPTNDPKTGRLRDSYDRLARPYADNLFDEYPNPIPNSTGGAFSNYSPFGFDGRFIYARASYNW